MEKTSYMNTENSEEYDFGVKHKKVKRSSYNTPRHYEQYMGWKINKDCFNIEILQQNS